MEHFLIFILLGLSLQSFCPTDNPKSSEDSILTNFAFGSNYFTSNHKSLNIFDTIKKHNPQLWLWTGDIAQVAEPTYYGYFKSTRELNKKALGIFDKLKNNEHYKDFHESTKVIGTWNELDYGIYNGNKDFGEKEIVKQYFLNFLDVPVNEERRQAGRGLYTTHVFGYGDKSVRFILLDVRYHKDSGIFSQDMLGEDQWNWLDMVLKNAKETLIFIVSPTQILPFNRLYTESWYTNSRKQLFNIIGKYRKDGVMFISGDVGFAQVLKTQCILPDIGYHLYEITSSGMSNFENQKFLYEKLLPHDYHYGEIYNGFNFGEIKINWGNTKEETKLEIGIFDIKDEKKFSLILNYEDLKFDIVKLLESEKEEKNCFMKTTKKYKFIHQYFTYAYTHILETLTVLVCVLLVIGILFILFKIFKFYILASIIIVLLAVLLKIYENYRQNEYLTFLE